MLIAINNFAHNMHNEGHKLYYAALKYVEGLNYMLKSQQSKQVLMN